MASTLLTSNLFHQLTIFDEASLASKDESSSFRKRSDRIREYRVVPIIIIKFA